MTTKSTLELAPLSAARNIAQFTCTLLYEPGPAGEERFRMDHALLGEVDRLLRRTAEAQKLESLVAAAPAIREALEKEQEWDVSSEPHPQARVLTSMQRHGGGFNIPEVHPAVSEIPERQLSEAVRALERRYFGSWTLEPGAEMHARLDEHFREPQERYAAQRAQ